MLRKLTVVVLVVGATLAGGSSAPADDPPAPDGLARLRGFGRPTIGPIRALSQAAGTITAVDERSVTIRSWFERGFGNAKEEDESGSDRFGRWLRLDPTKPIVLLYPGWEVDCHTVRYTPEGMAVTVLSGQEVVLRNADRPARRFPAVPEFIRGDPHPALPTRTRTRRYPFGPGTATSSRTCGSGTRSACPSPGALGKEECVGVTIFRRPDGRVPHSTQHPEFFRYGIDRDNAYQDHEERGTPIPERFRRDLQRLNSERLLRGDEPAPPPPKRP